MGLNLKQLSTEKSLIIFAILAHFAIALRVSLFEVSHAVIHTLEGEGYDHVHTHLGSADHTHPGLEVFRIFIDDQHCDHPIPRGSNSTKPIPRIAHINIPLLPPVATIELWKTKIPFLDTQLPATPFLRQPTPPPEYLG
ncbi:MAG: hypothetical protein AAFY48_13340 [Bacteroidota bacterium]